MYNLIANLIGYTEGYSSGTIINICGAMIIIFEVLLMYFVFRIITMLFFK